MRNPIASIALGVALSGIGTADDSLTVPTQEHVPTPVVAATKVLRSSSDESVVLTPSFFGVSLVKDSVARSLLSEVSLFWQRGAAAPDDKVVLLLTHARLENGTEITPDRVRAILGQHPSDLVRLALLRYLHETPLLIVSDGTLSRFITSQSPEVLKYAMLCRSKNIGHTAPSGFFARYIDHSELPVRSAALVATLAAVQSVPETVGASEAFVASRYLNTQQFQAGFEARLAKVMCDSLKATVSDKELIKDLPYLGMPLMHLLQRIDGAAPGYLDAVLQEGPTVFDEFCIQCAAFLKKKRVEMQNKVILSKESLGVVALHYEVSFSPQPAIDLFSAVGAQRPKFVKAGALPDGEVGYAAGEIEVYAASSARDEYLKDLDAIRTSDPKGNYLLALQEVAADRSRPCPVWHMMHGGPEHSWFYHGTPGTENAPDQMRHPEGVSYVELAETLFTSQIADVQKGITLSFGHITILLDACQQYTMAEGTLQELERLASRGGYTIESFPTIVPLTQPLMYGFLNLAFVSKSENSKVPNAAMIRVADALVNPLFSSLVEKARGSGELTVGDLMAAETKGVDPFHELLQDPKRLLAKTNSQFQTGEEVDARGLRLLNGQDPAVFGSSPCSLLEVLEGVRSGAQGRGITIPAVESSEVLERPTYLEISVLEPNDDGCAYG
jgi:hypothetical protein